MPCVCWESSNKPITVVEGTTFAMTNVLMEKDGDNQSLLIDSGWFDAPGMNQYTLSADKIAGHVDAPETVEEVVDDGAVAAPQTFDAGVIAAAFAIVSAAGYAISKKR